ncbi:MAG: hypothetical protein ABIG32_00120 [Candidatus Uhrbacteria bacterium]|nr:hypothetical protein [Patescibacteria group bacterium]MBU1906909.1 hypothetical protein [Patescibacteria group bacterium]
MSTPEMQSHEPTAEVIKPELPEVQEQTLTDDEVGRPIYDLAQTETLEEEVEVYEKGLEELEADLELAKDSENVSVLQAAVNKTLETLKGLFRKKEKIVERAKLESYLGSGLDPAKEQAILEKLETNPEVVGEFEGVRLALVNRQKLEGMEGEHLNFIIQAQNPETGQFENAGSRSMKIMPDRAEFEMIQVFDGDQPDEISTGSFRGQGIGPLSEVAAAEYLNKLGLNGKPIETTAVNQEFNQLFRAAFDAKDIAPNFPDIDMWEGHIVSKDEMLANPMVKKMIDRAVAKRQQAAPEKIAA